MANLTSPFAVTLLGHDVHFEPIVGILWGQIKDQDFTSSNVPLPPSINRDEFHGMKEEKSKPNLGKNQSSPVLPFTILFCATIITASLPQLLSPTTLWSSLQH
jgi:H+/gluconate symporter-like permease